MWSEKPWRKMRWIGEGEDGWDGLVGWIGWVGGEGRLWLGNEKWDMEDVYRTGTGCLIPLLRG